MPKHPATFTLFIACPSDITTEKKIIKELCQEYNDVQGDVQNVRIEVRDWESHAYPLYGSHPQEMINEQVLGKSDFVVGLFWTKFGFPTNAAGSATEEEILLAIKRELPLMLYFSDKHINPSLIDNSQYQKVLRFRENHKNENLYWTFSTEDEFARAFRRHLSSLVNEVLIPGWKQPVSSDGNPKSPQKEQDSTGVAYQPPQVIEKLIKENFKIYWAKVFNIIDRDDNVLPNGMIFNKQNKNKVEIEALKQKLKEWNTRIIQYCSDFQQVFDIIDQYDLDELKNDIVGEKLWTVKGALKNPERELDRYRDSFNKAESYLIKETIKNILDAVKKYETHVPERVAARKIKGPDDFKFEILVHPPTLFKGVIGKGIRSEILHKYNPSLFTLMTRKSIWGLYFITNKSDEFVFDDEYKGQFRTIHNYDYLYDRFSYYNYVIYSLFEQYLAKYQIKLDEKLKYGYANLFLIEIERIHKADIGKLKRPQKVNV